MTELHLCIATGHNAANFIPLKQLQAREVWILQTSEMKKQHSGAHLALALKPYVPHIRTIDFDDRSPHTIAQAATALADSQLDGRHVIFHITGGTKLMVLAIHEQLRLLASGSGSYRLLYADTARQSLDWLDPEPHSQPMADVLTLQDLLLLRGYRITNDARAAKDQPRAAARATVTRKMGEQAKALEKFFSALAYKANLAADGQALTQHFDYPPGGPAAKLLELAAQHQLLHWSAGQTQIRFTTPEAARYFAGGWAEEYAFLKLNGLLTKSQYAMAIRVARGESAVANEIDAIAVKNNRALLIECKTGKQSRAQDAIYKLGQLVREIGGLMARGLYLSAQPLSPADRQRAKDYRLDVLAAEELTGLSAYLRQWAEPSS